MANRAHSVFDVLPDLAAAIDGEGRDVVRRAFARRTATLPPGPWDPAELEDQEDLFGLVVLDGTLLRIQTLDGRQHTEVHASGDVVTPWVQPEGLIAVDVAWAASGPVVVTLLDHTFLAAVARWPALTAVLLERYGQTCGRLAVHKAICQLPRVEERVLYVLWHIAERVGRVRPDGVHVPLALTHEQLGHLVGARRSTVTLALSELEAVGHVRRGDGDGFLLLGSEPPFVSRARPQPARRRRAVAAPPTGESRSVSPVDLRLRLEALGVMHRETAERTARELRRARIARDESLRLRAALQHRRQRPTSSR